jgi:hypothetical protein
MMRELRLLLRDLCLLLRHLRLVLCDLGLLVRDLLLCLRFLVALLRLRLARRELFVLVPERVSLRGNVEPQTPLLLRAEPVLDTQTLNLVLL